MIVVTGAFGFIGSNIVNALNKHGKTDIIVVDDLSYGHKIKNLPTANVADYFDKDDFLEKLSSNKLPYNIDAIIHMGANSCTTDWDGKQMMRDNFEYTKFLFHYCHVNEIKLIYASSASVYGNRQKKFDEADDTNPINAYAYSKFLADHYALKNKLFSKMNLVGLRFFNVYGPGETFKGNMASPVFQFNAQILQDNECRVFGAYDGFGAGEHMRDFVWVGDCVDICLWFLQNDNKSGIYNIGSGSGSTFGTIADQVIKWHVERRKVTAQRKVIPFPDHLKSSYQSYTLANISKLRNAGYTRSATQVNEGINAYLEWMNADLI
jgi:ADP-L-glycero-D-manno-heptose 6-epimerase